MLDTVDLPPFPQFKLMPVKCCYSHSLSFNCVFFFSALKYGMWNFKYFLQHKITFSWHLCRRNTLKLQYFITWNMNCFCWKVTELSILEFLVNYLVLQNAFLEENMWFFIFNFLFCVLISWYIWGEGEIIM